MVTCAIWASRCRIWAAQGEVNAAEDAQDRIIWTPIILFFPAHLKLNENLQMESDRGKQGIGNFTVHRDTT